MRRSILVTLFLFPLGCGNDSGGGGGVDGGGDAPPVDGVPPSEVRFQRDVVPIFTRSCGNNNDGCHNRKAYAASANFNCRGWLSLENAAVGSQVYAGPTAGQATGCPDRSLHYRLTMIAAWQCGQPASSTGQNVSYAKANDLDNSYLIRKIRGIGMCDEGGAPTKRMPPPPPDSAYTISPADVSTLEAWIMSGAKDD